MVRNWRRRVRRSPSWIAPDDLLHLRGCPDRRRDAPDQDETNEDGEDSDGCRVDQPARLAAGETEPLVPALGREDAETHSVDAPSLAPPVIAPSGVRHRP